MLFKGKIKGISRDWKTNTPILEIFVNEGNLNEIEALQDVDLSVEVKRYRRKRSLDANAYLWVLCTKIAEVMKTSKDEVYEDLLQRYGYVYQDDDGMVVVTVKASVDMRKVQGHWKFYKGDFYTASYLMLKGTSEYDTGEMAHFLDMVVGEAKELNIETLTPNELERMKALWSQ